MKKLTALILTCLMVCSFSMTAWAAGEGESASTAADFSAGNTAETTVSLQATSGQLAATVPLTVTLAVQADGNILGPNNYAITNTSIMPIKVTEVTVAAKSGFAITGATEGTTDIGNITLNTTALKNWSSTVGGTNWNMAAKDASIPITLAGNLTSIGQDISAGTPAFTITYTIAAGAHAQQ